MTDSLTTLSQLSGSAPAPTAPVPAVQPTLSSLSAPQSQTEAIKANIAKLQDALLFKHPTMPVLLREIHRQLKEDPATVTLLEESEIAVIVNGLENQTGTFIAASMSKSSTSKTAALKRVTTDDLGF